MSAITEAGGRRREAGKTAIHPSRINRSQATYSFSAFHQSLSKKEEAEIGQCVLARYKTELAQANGLKCFWLMMKIQHEIARAKSEIHWFFQPPASRLRSPTL